MKNPWEGQVSPFRIYGNLYFIGTQPASTHIIDTGDGLIMIDPGYPQSLYLVIDGIYRMGFKPEDVKVILLSHGHYDHLGGVRGLLGLCSGKTYIGEADVPYADGSLDLTWAAELGVEYKEAFTPDAALHDGDVITLGNTSVLCIHTPGHTPGTFSFFFDAVEDGVSRRCGMFGGAGLNSLETKHIEKYGLSYSCRTDYLSSVDRLMKEDVDIFLGNHAHNNRTIEKGEALARGDANPFINTNDEWKAFLEDKRRSLIQKIFSET